jgi:hypothetical protein
MFQKGDRVKINESTYNRTPWTKHSPGRLGTVTGYSRAPGQRHLVYVRWDGSPNKDGKLISDSFLVYAELEVPDAAPG